ncbi:ABC transporter permease [Pendulispora albinea]|uniref:ABC transporter permease n=1 Tax=Pendulispora albinea TaxID=2741071 RepID=A0ABZ2M9C2_9BACT
MTLLLAVFSLSMLGQTLRTTVPYVCAALGGLWSERSGVVNIALEGLLLVSGMASVMVHHATGSAWAGVLAGAGAAALFALVHALLVVYGRIDAIVSGIALNLLAAGTTRFLLRALYDSSSNSPSVTGFRIPALDGASGILCLARTLIDPLTVLAVLAGALTWFYLYRTRFGLRVRAAGEDPDAAASVGVRVSRLRVVVVTLGGAICGLGGVALAYDQHQFQAGMSGGRGFIAVAVVVLSGWRPVHVVVACTAFAALEALQVVLQGRTHVPSDLVQMLPYVFTLGALFFVARRRSIGGRAPAGLGKMESS